MKIMKEFNYLSPKTVKEAASLLAKFKKEAKVIAGGTDLLVMMKDRIITPKYVVDIKPISALDVLRWDQKEGLRIGALARIFTILNSEVIKEKYFCLHQAAESVGTVQVRNMATIGGNICRSSPSADMVPPLLVFDAEATLVGPESERTVFLEDFFTGPGENVLDDEILTEIRILPQRGSYGTAFKKLGRTSEDLAKVNCAVKIVIADGKCEDVRIALGAVAPTPIRAKRVEEALRGQKASFKVVADAIGNLAGDIVPITDVRSNAEYRTYICRIVVKRLIEEAIKRSGAELDV
jgi:CO/xanthine dehydrogenase FAD-binding subunit